MPTILFVCTGNTCRSPMAAAIAGDVYRGRKDHVFMSRGISVPMPSRATESAIQSAYSMGLDIREHISRQISEADIRTADLVITMTESQKEYLCRVYSKFSSKVFTLCSFSEGTREDIADPYGHDVVTYKKCAEEIRLCFGDAFDRKLSKLVSTD